MGIEDFLVDTPDQPLYKNDCPPNHIEMVEEVVKIEKKLMVVLILEVSMVDQSSESCLMSRSGTGAGHPSLSWVAWE